MNFPYISILPLIDEVKTELKKITRSSSYSEEDMYGFAVDAARLIGQTSYETVTDYKIEICKHTGKLPTDFYIANLVLLCDFNRTGNNVKGLRTMIMRPADTITATRCSTKCIEATKRLTDVLSFSLKVPPGIIRTSFDAGTVSIDYEKLKLDEHGIVMIQDEINSIMAIKNYLIVCLIREDYIRGSVNRGVYKDFESLWEKYKELAQQIFKFPNNHDQHFLALQQDQRYRKFNYKNQ